MRLSVAELGEFEPTDMMHLFLQGAVRAENGLGQLVCIKEKLLVETVVSNLTAVRRGRSYSVETSKEALDEMAQIAWATGQSSDKTRRKATGFLVAGWSAGQVLVNSGTEADLVRMVKALSDANATNDFDTLCDLFEGGDDARLPAVLSGVHELQPELNAGDAVTQARKVLRRIDVR